MSEWAGKVALVTGGTSGIGREAALLFAKRGAKVVVAGRRDVEGNQTVDLIRRDGGEGFFVKADVSQTADVKTLIEKTVATFGGLDCAFNNAGVEGKWIPIVEQSDEDWDRTIAINLKGTWLCLKYEMQQMLKQGRAGAIVNNSSVAGLRGMARLSHYAASKWGLVGLTKSWAIELAPYNIRVVSLHPTGVNTPMNDGLSALEGLTPEQVAGRSAGNLLAVPWVEPEDVAAAVVFLASDRARFITGSQFVLDAGLLSR